MLYSTRSKLVAGFVGVSFLVGAVSLVVGGERLDRSVRKLVKASRQGGVEHVMKEVRGLQRANADFFLSFLSFPGHKGVARHPSTGDNLRAIHIR